MSNNPSEISALNAQIEVLKSQVRVLTQENESLKTIASNRSKVGVTLKNGQSKYYDADTYQILPNDREPKLVEFRKMDTSNHTYHVVATVNWSEIAELHLPAA